MDDYWSSYHKAAKLLDKFRPDLAEELIIEGKKSGSADGDDEKEGAFSHLMSVCHIQHGQYEDAHREIIHALDIFDDGKFGSYCHAYVQLGNVFLHHSLRQSSLSNNLQGYNFLKAMECLSFPEKQPFIVQNNPSTIADAYILKSELMLNIDEPIGAEMYAMRAMKIVSEEENGDTFLRAMLSLSKTSLFRHDYESSTRLATDALEVAKDQNLPARVLESRISQGTSLRAMQKWTSSAESLQMAIQEADDIGDWFSKLRAIRQLIEVRIITGQDSEISDLDSEVWQIFQDFANFSAFNEEVFTVLNVIWMRLGRYYSDIGKEDDSNRVLGEMVELMNQHTEMFGDSTAS